MILILSERLKKRKSRALTSKPQQTASTTELKGKTELGTVFCSKKWQILVQVNITTETQTALARISLPNSPYKDQNQM